MENKKQEPVLLRMENITKEFPGVKALDNVSLTVRAGTVHALMGENGAGKSTLMKCLFGVYNKDSGHIYLEGKEIKYRAREELAIAFQHEMDHLNGILFVDHIDPKNPFKNKDYMREI